MVERYRGHPEGITSIPDIPLDDVGRGLGATGVDTFVISYVGWATQDTDGLEPPEADDKTLKFFLVHGQIYLNNTPEQTKELLRWMEENPFRVAEYLNQVWPNVADGKAYTDPFRLKALKQQIPKFNPNG